MRAELFWLSTLPPARLSSGWVATGAHYLPSNLLIHGRPGKILPALLQGYGRVDFFRSPSGLWACRMDC